MNVFALLPSDLSTRLMLTFGHCLWEGLLIAAAATVMTRWLCGRNANRRYSMFLAALVLLVASLPVTFLLIGPAPATQLRPNFASSAALTDVHENPSAGGIETIVPISVPAHDATISQSVDPPRTGENPWNGISEWVSWAYLAGVLLMLARLGVSLSGAQRICRNTIPVDSPELLKLFEKLVRELGLRAAPALAYSERIVAPAVIGIVRPTILLPISLATSLGPDELASILAHELAHIRRYDLWVNMFQRFAESLLFFHPAVWFLSRRLSAEREFCCDDVALSRGLGSIRYAELLVRLAEVRCRVSSAVEQQVALAAAGDRPSQLHRRVARLFELEEELTMTLTRRGAMTLAATFVMAAALFTVSVPAKSTDDAAAPAAEAKKAEGKAQPSAPAAGSVGSWKGKVALKGTAPTLKPDERVLVKDGGVANVFIFLQKAPAGTSPTPPSAEVVTFDRKNSKFIPHALLLRAGQKLAIKSSDAGIHNLHTHPKRNSELNQMILPAAGVQISYEKPEAEPIEVKNDLLPSMIAYHLPIDHQFAALSGADGTFEIKDLPAGEHKFVVWHEGCDGKYLSRSFSVMIKPGEETTLDIPYPSSKLAVK